MNSSLNLVTITSKCNSPTPEIIFWPVSLFVVNLNVGSSSANLSKPIVIFSWSAFVFGSIASEITGSEKLIDSRSNSLFSSQSVSPVVVDFKPTAAPISPALTSSTSSLLFEFMITKRENLSLTPFVEL